MKCTFPLNEQKVSKTNRSPDSQWRPRMRGLAVGLIPLVAFVVLTGGLLYGQGRGDALFIDKEGNIGIGTDQPRAKLDVRGTLEASELDVSGTIKARQLYLDGTRNGVPVGTIVAYFGTVAPEGWLLCDGSPINKSHNPAYAFLVAHLRDETKVGSKAFQGPSEDEALLPDLRGRVPLGAGSGTNLTARTLGERGGEETHRLTVAEMPRHSHNWLQGRDRDDQGWGKTNDWEYVRKPGNFPGLIAETGGDQPHNTMQPFLAVHYIVKY